jgi:hypothetical protein
MLDFPNDGAHRSCRIPIALLLSVRNNPSSISTTRVRLQRHINIIYRQPTVSLRRYFQPRQNPEPCIQKNRASSSAKKFLRLSDALHYTPREKDTILHFGDSATDFGLFILFALSLRPM